VAGAGRPPTIIDESRPEMSYKVSEKVQLVCVATGDPLPSYVLSRPLSFAVFSPSFSTAGFTSDSSTGCGIKKQPKERLFCLEILPETLKISFMQGAA